MTDDAKFDQWGILEIMGHQRYAGRITSESIAGPMIRIDVPAIDECQAFTKYFAPNAVYGITPTSEAVARESARAFRQKPIDVYTLEIQRNLPISALEGDEEEY